MIVMVLTEEFEKVQAVELTKQAELTNAMMLS